LSNLYHCLPHFSMVIVDWLCRVMLPIAVQHRRYQ
jgi:hypothetical protein